MSNLLSEVLNKVNFLLSHTYIMIDGKVENLMEMYNAQLIDKATNSVHKVIDRKEIQSLKEYAFQTGNFSIEKDCVIVEKEDTVFEISLGDWNNVA